MKYGLLSLGVVLLLFAFGSVALGQEGGITFLPVIANDGAGSGPTATAVVTPLPTETAMPTITPIPTQTPGVTPTAAAEYAVGDYAGSSSVTFTATDAGEICDFHIEITSGIATCTIEPAACAPIVDRQFIFESSIPGATYGITGTWETTTMVEGTHSTFIWCEDVFMLFGGTPRWSAERVE